MSLTIVATAGANNANSYVGETEATAYFASRPDSAWTATTDADKKRAALIEATRQLDRLRWRGEKYANYAEGNAAYQPLQFPRTDSWSGDNALPYSYDDSSVLIIPKEIREACLEQANYILGNDTLGEASPRVRLQNEGVSGISMPGMSEQYGGRVSAMSDIAPQVMMVISKWLLRGARADRG